MDTYAREAEPYKKRKASQENFPHVEPDQPKTYGCDHYSRRCKLVMACCLKEYWCRFCHDITETHPANRRAITEIICEVCQTRQIVAQDCISCGTRFGAVFCNVCRLYDDEEKGQFHCNACGLCYVGGAENYYHCYKCNSCVLAQLISTHSCEVHMSDDSCPVCAEDLTNSRIPLQNLSDCEHVFHAPCFIELIATGCTACPSCDAPLKRIPSSASKEDLNDLGEIEYNNVELK